MLSPLRNRFGIPGVISVIALVFAMLGGAYAASDSSDGGKATASAKAKKGPRGPRGPKGPAGPAGLAGPAGPAGAKGDTGAAGSNGTNGKDGAPGKDGTSVTSEEFGTLGKDGKCVGTGGSKFVAGASKTYACNGKEGSPWAAGGVLPSEATETGAWAFGKLGTAGEVDVPISFPIPLAAPLGASNVHFIRLVGTEWKEVVLSETTFEPEFVTPTNCLGTSANPTAQPGHLCVYAKEVQNVVFISNFGGIRGAGSNSEGADTAGAVLFGQTESNSRGRGTWAVTAPPAP